MADTGVIVSGSDYDYDAYGNPLGFDPAAADTAILYTNQLFDPVLGQYVLRARYYDAGIGRFSSFDSHQGYADEPTSLHKYTYVSSNPLNLTDPSGNSFLTDTMVAAGLVTGLFIGVNAGLIAYRRFGQGQTLARAVDDQLSWYPWAISDNGSLRSPTGVISHNKQLINQNGRVPPLLLASVLLAELRDYNAVDSITDSQRGRNRSIGIAQINTSTIIDHSRIRPDLYPEVNTDMLLSDRQYLEIMIERKLTETPYSINLLAREIQFFAETSAIDLRNWDSGSEDWRQNLVRLFTAAKDTNVLGQDDGFGEHGIKAYDIIKNGDLLRP